MVIILKKKLIWRFEFQFHMCTGPFLGILLILKGLEKKIETKESEIYYLNLEISVIINYC